MGRFRRNRYEDYAQEFGNDESYNRAFHKVKRMKSFYTHLKVYLIVNAIIIVSRSNSNFMVNSDFCNWHTFSTPLFWGIALAGHALSVFGQDIFFSSDWEQKKIQKYMDKEQANTNKWE